MSILSITSFAPASAQQPRTFRGIARPEDAEAVERLVRSTGVFNDTEIAIARELVEEWLNRGAAACGYHFQFADGTNGLEGYACSGPIPGTAKRYELYWIVVAPAARRAGLGRSLQLAAEDSARALGATYMMAETSTRPEYLAARSFYQSLGYTLLAQVPDWHDDGDGLAIYGKRL